LSEASQPCKSAEAANGSEVSGRQANRGRRQFRLERVDELAHVGGLVGDKAPNVALQLCYPLGRICQDFGKIPPESVGNFEDSIFPPGQLVWVSAVIVDDG
jgi:hypothetical protein